MKKSTFFSLFRLVSIFLVSQYTNAQISGVVFRDFNANGIKESSTTFQEPGVAGIIVTATDNAGTSISSTTASDGTYSLTVGGAGKYRVEFTGFQGKDYEGAIGNSSNSSVQFVDVPVGGITNVDLGINYPDHYSNGSPPLLFTPCYATGNEIQAGNEKVFVKWSYPEEGKPNMFGGPAQNPEGLANLSQLGTVWGLAYNRQNQQLYAAAFLKRHTILLNNGNPDNGLGNIFVIDPNTGNPALFFNLYNLGIDVGTVSSNADRGIIGGTLTPSQDSIAYDKVGKLGIGDIDISTDNKTLWIVVINEANPRLVAVTLDADNNPTTPPTSADVKSWPITLPCVGGISRPFGLKYYRGQLYVGIVCDGITSQNKDDLSATVLRFDPSVQTFTNVLNFPLNYTKGIALDLGPCAQYTGWYPWTNDYTFPPVGTPVCSNNAGNDLVRPTPMLTDIEFDVEGSMILGFTDRWGNQVGNGNYSPLGGGFYDVVSTGGDILRAAPNGSGGYIIENNGTSGGVTTPSANNGDGIGGGEYYNDNYSFHKESSQGGIALWPGSGEVVSTALDPIDPFTGGVRKFNNKTGVNSKAYQIFSGGFGKANGLGDLEISGSEAPIQIGNRIWKDSDGDGIQDPEELPLVGVSVALYENCSGNAIATATTDANGNYYFSSASGTSSLSSIYGLTLNYSASYCLKVTSLGNDSSVSGLSLTALSPVVGEVSNQPNSGLTTINSDAFLEAGFPTIRFQTGNAGENNYSFDVGFPTCVKPDAGSDAASICQPIQVAKLTAVSTGGTWVAIASGNPSPASIDNNGNITGLVNAGTYKFVYKAANGGDACTDTAQVVVLAKPVISDGSATICADESVDLTSKITNYNTYLNPVWTVGTASGTVVTTPSSVKPTGTTTYVLVAQNAAGCKDTANVVVTVNAKPNAGKDTTLACLNAANNTLATSITLSPSPAGGTWSQLGTTPTTATISGNNVTGMTIAGTYQFIYTTTAGCKDTLAVTVASCPVCVKPNAGADAANVCQPTSTAKLTAVTTGGTWAPIVSPANPSAATIDASGNISGLNAAGTYKFVYSVTSGGQTCTDTAQVVVLAKPVIADGSATICAGESVDLTSKITNYNTYLSPVWTVGTANGTVVAAPKTVKPTGTTTYVLVAQNAAGCKDTANVVVTVNVKPNAGKDTTLACVNAATNTLATSYTLVPSPAGGSWSQLGTTPTTATITGNNVTGMSVAGTYQFIYTTTAGCKDTVAVTVAPCAGCVKPNAGADAANVCQPIKTAKLTAVTAGGTWAPIVSPANPSAATIDANGNISGLNAAGTYRFVYSVTSGGQTCTDTAQVVVLAKPVIADGSATICAGESVDLTSKITNYNTYLSPVWTVGTANGTVVTTPASVKPTGTTTYVLVAQNAAGCKDTANVVVTVNAKPSAGKDTTLVCSNGNVPSSVQLSATPTGGTWSALTGNPTGATVSSSGLVSITNATAQGKSFNFVYSVNGCQDTVKVIVPTCPAPCIKSSISSAAPVCSNDAQTYSFTFTVTNKLGIVKVNKGTLSGNNPYTVSGIPSGQSVLITDSLSAICKTDTTIAGVNCNCNPALPQLLTPSLTACIGDTFPTLKATVVGLATVEWFSQQTGGTVLATGLSFKPSGTVTANTVFYAQARSTDPTCPTAVSTSRVPATINAQDCTKEVDLALSKSISKKIAQIGDVLTYTLKVWNESATNATGVSVTDSIATTVQFLSGSFVASRGSATISGNVIKWNIGSISANGDTVTLTYQIKVTQEGVHFNTAEICTTNEKDVDSTPCNDDDTEDDIDRECFTVPVKLCPGEVVEVNIPAKYINVQWFKNGGTTPVASGNSLLLSDLGSYTFTATNQTCPAEGCCPVIIEAGTNCCPVDLCIPFTIKQTKKAGKKL